LRVHLGAALRCGVDPDELIALCEHLAPYAGFPRALNLLRETRAILEELDLSRPRPTRRIEVGDHETIVSETGQGEAYILIHCLGLDWRVWRDVIPELAEQYRVIAYDLRGHGYASNAPRLESIDQLARDLMVLMDELSVKKAHIAGHSLGGTVAQTIALEHPERVVSLALLNTMGRTLREKYEARAEDAERQGMAAQVAPSLLRWLTPEVVAENPWYVRYARERILRSQISNWVAAWRALAAFDRMDDLARISAPTQVVAGDKDLASPAEEFMRPMAEKIPHAKLTIVAGAPHLSPLVKPHDVATLLSHV
jgi:3-oxoadipate enol-lactonase